jgi:photosystem II stability/assembly factor-like uncharacterized protein
MQFLTNRWLLRVAGLAAIIAAVAAVGAPRIARAWERWERARWHRAVFAAYNQMQHDDGSPPLVLPEEEHEGEVEEDDATIRRLYTTAYFGVMTPDAAEQIVRARAAEAVRWAHLMPGARTVQPNAVVVGQSWVNLGPTDARIQKNGAVYNGIDSGRAATIRVDPRDANIVYLATASGGVWKSYDFTTAAPHWVPITDNVGSGFVGAFDLDPKNPDTLWMGLGDALDNTIAGGSVFKSTDGGGTWKMMTPRLSGTYGAAAGARSESAVAIRDLAIDPTDGQ